MPYSASGYTDSGKIRTFNEDNYLVFVHQDVLYMMIADGIGSRPGHEIASIIALREIRSFLERYVPANPNMETVQYFLEQACYVANKVLRSFALANGENYSNWGTTFTAVAINRGYEYTTAHIGNTRFYILRNGQMLLQTKDHTEAQTEIDFGRITEEQRWTHPGRSLVTRSLGMSESVFIDKAFGQAQWKDLLLLTTDGIHGVLTLTGMQRLILDAGETAKAVEQLVEGVNELGGPDNSAAILSYCEY